MKLITLYVISVAFFNYMFVFGNALSRPPWIVGMLLVVAALISCLREGKIPRPGAFGFALFLFAVTTIANGMQVWLKSGFSMADYARSELQFLMVLAIVFAFVHARLDEYAVARLLKVWVWMAVAAAVFGIYEAFARVIGLPFPDLPIAARGYTGTLVKEFFGFFAASSWFAEPSWFGSFLVIPFLYVMSVLLLDPPPPFCFRSRRTAGAVAALLVLGLFVSLSQAAYVTILAVSIPLIWSVRDRVYPGRLLRLAAVPVLLVLIVTLALGSRGGDIARAQWLRFTAVVQDWQRPEVAWQISSYGSRVSNMQGAVALWASDPIMGVGINQMRYVPEGRRVISNLQGGSVDSGLFQLLVDQGLLGVLTLGLALVILWRRIMTARAREVDPGRQFLLWFLGWALIADVVNSIVTHPWQHPQRWLIISLAASFLASERRTKSVAGGME